MTLHDFAQAHPHEFGVILADPPWKFHTWNEINKQKSPKYDLMDLQDIKALPVQDIAAKDCTLFLWATQAQLHHAFETMNAWGFAFKTAGAWAKQSRTLRAWAFGTGYLLRSSAEFFLVGTRGSPKTCSHRERNLIIAPLREHSRKPDQLYEMIERMFPSASRCELFARRPRDGWTSWGDTLESAT
jgi:N6-adenosine-specific RNA methylase IME4